MKILIVHNAYKQKGGEDSVVHAESIMLRDRGHDVLLYWVDNEGISSFKDKIETAIHAAWSGGSHRKIIRQLYDFRPDIVHIHNFFPQVTPSVYDASHESGIPVVQTLHNYRTICPGALLMRDGKVCEICVNRSAYRSVMHRCYRGSFLGTLAVARMVEYHRRKKTWSDKVDAFIALTLFSRNTFVMGGFPPEKIHVKPNFITDPFSIQKEKRDTSALFVGRLSREKGIETLVTAWKNIASHLNIVGDEDSSQKKTVNVLPQVAFLGRLKREDVYSHMGKAQFLVMPSECYEGFPMVIAEAFAHGLPVLASRLGSMAEIVEDGVTGLHFEAGNPEDLARKARWMFENPDECGRMGENARKVFEARYTEDRNYRLLMDIYGQATRNFNKRGKA